MSRNFNETTSKITFTLDATQKQLTNFTVHHYVRRATAGEIGYGQVWAWENGAATRQFIFQNDNGDAGWGMAFQVGFSGGVYAWSCPYPGDTLGHWYTITYDGTSGGPTIYKDGVSQTITTRVTGSGTLPNDETTLIIGNRSDQTETWNGDIAEYAIWNRILDPSEISLLGSGYAPSFIQNGLVFYAPMIGTDNPEKEVKVNSGGTIVSSTKATHPDSIKYPRGTSKIVTRPAAFSPGIAR